MNRTLKRALAATALAPIAALAVVAPAGAAVDPAPQGLPIIDPARPSVRCEHPNVSNLIMDLAFTLEGTGSGSDNDDIRSLTVTVSDNDGTGDYANADARAEGLRVEYFDYVNDLTAIDGDRHRLSFEEKRFGRRGAAENQSVVRGEDNVGYVRATATWSRVDSTNDAETLTCVVKISEF